MPMKTLMHTESSMGLGGQELRILLEMKAFEEKGYRCVLGCQPGSHIFKRAKEMGFPIYQVRMRSSVDPLAITSFYRFIRKESVSILHTHSSLDSWVAGIAGRFAKVPTIIRTRHVSLPVTNKLVYTLLADQVITTSYSIKKHIEDRCGLNGAKVHSIPTGVDLTRFDQNNFSGDLLREELGLDSKNILIGIIGMIRWCKGLDIFLESARLLLPEYPDVHFFVVGFDPDGKIDFAEEIRSRNLEKQVHYLGFREDIPEILSSLDILVSASTAAEGVSQAILQGFAMQKAVVATRTGGSPEVVLQQQTGLLVDPNDPEQLVQALKVLIDSPDLRKTYGMNGGKLVQEKFSKEHMVAQVEKVYQ